MNIFKREILKNITPRYIVISGPTSVRKTKNLKDDFIIVDHEVFDGDIYKEIYEFDKNIIKNEHVEFNNLMMVFFILCNKENLERNYYNRKENERKHSLVDCKNILKDLNQIINDIVLKYQNIFNINKKPDPKIIIITGPIEAGKTKLSNFLAEYLQDNGKKVNPNDQEIVFWFQNILIGEYKNYYNNCKFEDYNYVILDHSHIDTNYFTFAGITDNNYKKECLPYLEKKLNEINLKYNQQIINIFVRKKTSIKRILECGHEFEKDINYFNFIYDSNNKYTDIVYSIHFSFDNDKDLKTNKLKKNAYLRLDDKDQELFLNLLDLYSKHLSNVYNENIPEEGSNEYNLKKDFYDNIKKKCCNRNDIKNFEKAREEYKEKQKFVKIEIENQDIKKELLDQKAEKESLNRRIEEQDALIKRILKRLVPKVCGHKFERMLANFLNNIGGTVSIREVPDGGIDMNGKFFNVRYEMQAKYHIDPKKHPVDVGDIRKFHGSFQRAHRNNTEYVGIFVTNSRYTSKAISEEAQTYNKIYLYTHKDLYDLLVELNDKIIKNINNNGIITFENIDITNFSLNYSEFRISCDH
ncbi:8803_t:CDS:2, partial [Cetraspora pellucida]